MADLKCRYCGKDFDTVNVCKSGPKKEHVAEADGVHCVYCGKKHDTVNFCKKAPNNKHSLEAY